MGVEPSDGSIVIARPPTRATSPLQISANGARAPCGPMPRSDGGITLAAPYAAIIRAIAVAASPSLRATASTLAGGGETMSSQNAILFVHDPRDMQIFVRIHAADDATLYSFDDSHSQPPALTVHERLRRDRMLGQDSHETMRGQALLGSQASARQSPTARRPGRPTGPGKDTSGRSECGPGHAESPCGAILPNGPSL